MKSWPAVLLRRSVALPAIAVLILIGITVSLGNWQMRRADEKRQLATSQERAMADAPVDLGAAAVPARQADGKRARLEGRFEAESTIYLDNRTHRGIAGFHVITLMAPRAGGDPVPVLRGWIARDPIDRARLPALVTPTEQVVVEGLVIDELPQPIVLKQSETLPADQRIWQRYDESDYARWLGRRIQPVLLRQMSPLDDRLIRDWVQPGASIDKNLAYALQWYAMAACLAGFGLTLLWRMWRRESLRPAGMNVPKDPT